MTFEELLGRHAEENHVVVLAQGEQSGAAAAFTPETEAVMERQRRLVEPAGIRGGSIPWK